MKLIICALLLCAICMTGCGQKPTEPTASPNPSPSPSATVSPSVQPTASPVTAQSPTPNPQTGLTPTIEDTMFRGTLISVTDTEITVQDADGAEKVFKLGDRAKNYAAEYLDSRVIVNFSQQEDGTLLTDSIEQIVRE